MALPESTLKQTHFLQLKADIFNTLLALHAQVSGSGSVLVNMQGESKTAWNSTSTRHQYHDWAQGHHKSSGRQRKVRRCWFPVIQVQVARNFCCQNFYAINNLNLEEKWRISYVQPMYIWISPTSASALYPNCFWLLASVWIVNKLLIPYQLFAPNQ